MSKSKDDIDRYWSMPPIIGEVTNDVIIVVFRLRKSSHVRLKIYDNDKRESVVLLTQDYNVDTNVNRISIPNPRTISDNRYLCFCWMVPEKFNGDTYRENCIYTHYVPCVPDPDRIYIVSCDLLEADLKHSHWNTLHKYIDIERSNLLLHIGDQAYCDREFHRGCKRIRQDKYPIDTIVENVKEEYRQRYQATYRPHSNILSCVSNLCILDDHEIVNDSWDLDLHDLANRRVTEAALQVYHEYQFQLLADTPELAHGSVPDPRHPVGEGYTSYKISNGLLIMMVERTTHNVNIEIVLDEINHLCNTRSELFLEAKLVLCFTSAPIPRPEGITGRIHRRLFGDGKFWNNDNLKLLYDGLFRWMEADKRRSVWLCGGDIHFGVRGRVYHSRNGKEINVVVTSGITNYQTVDRRLAARAFRKCKIIDVTPNIAFYVAEAKTKRNFATIDLHLGSVSMTWSKKSGPKSMVAYRKQLVKMGGFGCGMTSMSAVSKLSDDSHDDSHDGHTNKDEFTGYVNDINNDSNDSNDGNNIIDEVEVPHLHLQIPELMLQPKSHHVSSPISVYTEVDGIKYELD